MRTWTLAAGFVPEGDPIWKGEEIRVIELEPVLDLLENWLSASLHPRSARNLLPLGIVEIRTKELLARHRSEG